MLLEYFKHLLAFILEKLNSQLNLTIRRKEIIHVRYELGHQHD